MCDIPQNFVVYIIMLFSCLLLQKVRRVQAQVQGHLQAPLHQPLWEENVLSMH